MGPGHGAATAQECGYERCGKRQSRAGPGCVQVKADVQVMNTPTLRDTAAAVQFGATGAAVARIAAIRQVMAAS